jgi:hypothetical protein
MPAKLVAFAHLCDVLLEIILNYLCQCRPIITSRSAGRDATPCQVQSEIRCFERRQWHLYERKLVTIGNTPLEESNMTSFVNWDCLAGYVDILAECDVTIVLILLLLQVKLFATRVKTLRLMQY